MIDSLFSSWFGLILFGLSGLAFHAILLNIVPHWGKIMKGIAVFFTMMPAIIFPFLILMFIFPFAPIGGLLIFAALIGITVYAIYYVTDVVF